MEGLDDAKKTQADFPHLLALSDEEGKLSSAAAIILVRGRPPGVDVDIPTVFLVDGKGLTRWLYQPPEFYIRLSVDEKLEAIDQSIP
jgi:hypothetical protein